VANICLDGDTKAVDADGNNRRSLAVATKVTGKIFVAFIMRLVNWTWLFYFLAAADSE